MKSLATKISHRLKSVLPRHIGDPVVLLQINDFKLRNDNAPRNYCRLIFVQSFRWIVGFDVSKLIQQTGSVSRLICLVCEDQCAYLLGID